MQKLVINIAIDVLILFGGYLQAQEKVAGKLNRDSLYAYRTASFGGIGKLYLGREIARVMNASNSVWLDRNSRPKEENTQLAIDKIEIPSTGVIADIGAGTGYYTFKLVPKVPRGKVYAVEIQDELIETLKERTKKLGLKNVQVVKGTTTSPNLPEKSVDMVIMVDVYHELEYPVEMLRSIRRSLKKDGKILLIEYKGEDPAVAIRPLHKTTVAQLKKELEANGFKLSYKGTFLPIQHYLVFSRVD